MNAIRICRKAKLIRMLVFIILYITSCKQDVNIKLSNNPIVFSVFPKNEKLTFEEIDEYKGGIPHRMFLVDSTLVISNYSKNIKYFFYNYSLKTGKFSKGYIRKGRGPNEAIGGFCSGIQKNTLWLYDATLNKVITIDKTEALNGNPLLMRSLPIDKQYYKLTLLDSLTFLSVGDWFSKFKIQQVDQMSNKKITEFGKFIGGIEDVPLEGLKDAYQAFIYSKPSCDKVVLAYRFTDAVEIFDLQNQNNYKMVQGPLGFDIDLKFNTSRGYAYFAKDEKTRKAFIAGTVIDKYIYLAYSGQIRSDENWNWAKYIHVYDWDGNPVMRLTFDRYISSLTVSNDDKIMYAFDINNGYIVKSEIN